MQFFPGMSFAVTTTNSSQLIPGPKLMFLIFPRGMQLRTVAPYSMLGSEISSMYRARPVTLSRPSFRGADTPIVAGPGMVRSRYCERKPPIFEFQNQPPRQRLQRLAHRDNRARRNSTDQ